MAAEALAHCREKLFRKRVLAARTEACIERGGKNIGGDRLLNGGHEGPATLAGILDDAGKAVKLRIIGKRAGGEVKEPRADHAAAAPYFGNVGDVEIETLAFGASRGCGILENIKTLGISLHESVLD